MSTTGRWTHVKLLAGSAVEYRVPETAFPSKFQDSRRMLTDVADPKKDQGLVEDQSIFSSRHESRMDVRVLRLSAWTESSKT